MNVEETLRGIVARRLKNAPPITAETKLADIALDSLDLIELIFDVEEAFDIHLTESNEQAKDASFAELVRWIEQHVAERERGAPAPRPERRV